MNVSVVNLYYDASTRPRWTKSGRGKDDGKEFLPLDGGGDRVGVEASGGSRGVRPTLVEPVRAVNNTQTQGTRSICGKV